MFFIVISPFCDFKTDKLTPREDEKHIKEKNQA